MNELIKRNVPIVIAAIVGVVIIEIYALYKGVNGTILVLVVGAICTLAGTKLGQVLEHRSILKEKNDKV